MARIAEKRIATHFSVLHLPPLFRDLDPISSSRYIPLLESFSTSSSVTREWVQLVDRFLVLVKVVLGLDGEFAVLLSAVQANSVDLIMAIFIGVILNCIFGISFGL